MRYAVFSDIHSNLEAFEAVLSFFKKSNIDQYLFLGDVVGYGADPGECIARLKEVNAISVAGNHDWAVADMLNTDYFNDAAAEAVRWTKEQTTPLDKQFLSSLSLVKEGKDFCLVHGTLRHPEEFDYMADSYRASKTFSLLQEKICFVGHSHWPGIFVEGPQKMTYRRAGALMIEEDKRYIINDGSVGQPRDGDPRACCCIYDEEASLIEFHRLNYDVATAEKKIREAALPAFLADRLALGR
jgi:predicted phosphodiesterase